MTGPNPPFRAEHVGSLLRPKVLLQARERLEEDVYGEHKGSIARHELRSLEDECITGVIKMQEDVGLQGITDGEFRRRSWFQDFTLEMNGASIKFVEGTFVDGKGHKLPTPTPHFEEKLRPRTGITTDAYMFLAGRTERTAKATLPSPNMAHVFGGRAAISAAVYPDLDEFWQDLALIYRQELAHLANIGCRYVQIDDCAFTMLLDDDVRGRLQERGDDPDQLLDTYIQAINLAIQERPEGVVLATHLCRGNNRGHWLASGGYDKVAEKLFTQLQVDAFFLEYDSSRAGTFEPLRFMPRDKKVVLGLISSKVPTLEDSNDVKRRIEQASKHVPLENLCLSPQCGFASVFQGNPVTEEHQRAKLSLIVDVANDVWGGVQ
ncbi:MAG: 5-methyltetrahydropteroyltriglutamate--homocysteine S-methyltransferase [Gammaproteobacteria bacterium]|nr:5-methyltetrahydropteroyltriglutamate--homocysteine S-methyltransferase [Gammaproteobacteria bacterium]